jgi:hypothetical protein
MKKENIYEKIQPLHKSLFECDFEFAELTTKEKEILRETLIRINETMMEFELFSLDKKIEPLETLIRLKNTKTTGDVKIKMHDKEGSVLGVVIFKTLKITEIKNLIDFDFEVSDYSTKSGKNIVIEFIYDDILYTSDGKEFEKIT